MSNLIETLKKLGFEIDHRSHPTIYLEGDGELCIISISDEDTGNSPDDETKNFHIQCDIENIGSNQLIKQFISRGKK